MEFTDKSLEELLQDRERIQKDLEEILKNKTVLVEETVEEKECKEDLRKVNDLIAEAVTTIAKNKSKNTSNLQHQQDLDNEDKKGDKEKRSSQKVSRGSRKRQLKKAAVSNKKTKNKDANTVSANKVGPSDKQASRKSEQQAKPRTLTGKAQKQLIRRIIKENQKEINEASLRKMRYYSKLGFRGKIKMRYGMLDKHRKLKNKAMLGIQSLFLNNNKVRGYIIKDSEEEVISQKWEQYLSGEGTKKTSKNVKKQSKEQANPYMERIDGCLQYLKTTTEKKKNGNSNGVVNEVNREVKEIAKDLEEYLNKVDDQEVKRKYMKTIYELYILGVPIKELPPLNLSREKSMTKKEKQQENIKFLRGVQTYSTYRYLKVEGENPELEDKYEEAYEKIARNLKSVTWEMATARIRYKVDNNKKQEDKKDSLEETKPIEEDKKIVTPEESKNQAKVQEVLKKYLKSLQQSTQKKRIIGNDSMVNGICGKMKHISKQLPYMSSEEINQYNQIMYELYIAGEKKFCLNSIGHMRKLQNYIASRHNEVEEKNPELATKYEKAYSDTVYDIYKKFNQKSSRFKYKKVEQLYGTPKDKAKKVSIHDEH